MISHRLFARLTTAVALCASLAGPVASQSGFSPAVIVNDRVVTYFEIDQRALLLNIMNRPGNVDKLAKEQLIEERLQLEAAEINGIFPSEEGVEAGIQDFARRVNMKPEDMLKALEKDGLYEATLRDFLYAQIAWRGVIQTRYGSQANISEEEIDRAIASNSGSGGINVLLSEIVIPVTPQTISQVQSLSLQISELTSVSEFAEAARQYSGSRTKDNDGRIDWMSITRLPPELRPQIMALKPGEVTAPVSLPNAVALFQLRSMRETGRRTPNYSAVDYAALSLPGGRSEQNMSLIKEIVDDLDTCDDLYGAAKDMPRENLVREAVAPGEVPRDYGVELAKLDKNEVSTNVQRRSANGEPIMVLLMMCGRTVDLGEEVSREDVANSLRNQRLQSFANGYMSQLRAEARIVE